MSSGSRSSWLSGISSRKRAPYTAGSKEKGGGVFLGGVVDVWRSRACSSWSLLATSPLNDAASTLCSSSGSATSSRLRECDGDAILIV